jgi:hypothetical protein
MANLTPVTILEYTNVSGSYAELLDLVLMTPTTQELNLIGHSLVMLDPGFLSNMADSASDFVEKLLIPFCNRDAKGNISVPNLLTFEAEIYLPANPLYYELEKTRELLTQLLRERHRDGAILLELSNLSVGRRLTTELKTNTFKVSAKVASEDARSFSNVGECEFEDDGTINYTNICWRREQLLYSLSEH